MSLFNDGKNEHDKSACDGCDGTGIRSDASYDGWSPSDPEVTLVQRCDTCARFADDFEAALAYGQIRGVICKRKPEDMPQEPKTPVKAKDSDFVHCLYVSRWDGGNEVETEGRFNPKTFEVESLESVEDDGEMEILEDEYIILDDGDELPVCPECHSYVMKNVLVPDNTGKGLHEEVECPNPDCEKA